MLRRESSKLNTLKAGQRAGAHKLQANILDHSSTWPSLVLDFAPARTSWEKSGIRHMMMSLPTRTPGALPVTRSKPHSHGNWDREVFDLVSGRVLGLRAGNDIVEGLMTLYDTLFPAGP